MPAAASRTTRAAEPHRSTMRAASGRGVGLANVRALPNPTFSADITVVLVGVAPNTTYTLQRAPEVGRPLATDRICQRANEQFPWEQPNSPGFPPAPAYPTFVLPTTPPTNVTLTTNKWGVGHARFHFEAPTIPAGAAFDVQFRAIDLTGAAPSIVSDCFQVTPQ